METFSVILFLLGSIGILTFIILFLVRLFFKKGMASKKILSFIGLSVALFIVSIVIMPEPTPEEKAEIAHKKNEKEVAAAAKAEQKQMEAEKKEAEKKRKEEVAEKKKEKVAAEKAKEEKLAKEKADKERIKLEKKKKEEKAEKARLETEQKEKKEAEEKKRKEKEAKLAEQKKKEAAAKEKAKKKEEKKKKEAKTENDIRDVIHKVFGKKNDFNKKDSIKKLTYDKRSKHLSVIVYGKDNLWMVKDGMLMDITDTIKEFKKNGLVKSVNFSILFPLQDQYGNESYDPVIKASFNKGTIEKINTKNFLYDNIPNIADEYWEHPALSK